MRDKLIFVTNSVYLIQRLKGYAAVQQCLITFPLLRVFSNRPIGNNRFYNVSDLLLCRCAMDRPRRFCIEDLCTSVVRTMLMSQDKQTLARLYANDVLAGLRRIIFRLLPDEISFNISAINKKKCSYTALHRNKCPIIFC